MTFAPLGDHAVVVTLGEGVDEAVSIRVRTLVAVLEHARPRGLVDIVAAYATVTVFYEPAHFSNQSAATPYDEVCRVIEALTTKIEASRSALAGLGLGDRSARESVATVEIPVCYGGEFGPDLDAVAVHSGLQPAEVIRLHASATYVVCAIGFSPGFPYLSGLSEKLRTPRRSTPRTTVLAGSVGIGWTQTGIYPLQSPGGWQLIGRTPLPLFDLKLTPPALLGVGDKVKFKPLAPEEFTAWK